MVEVFKGTTTVGVLCDGGVVLASESRATMGNFIASSTAKKIYQVDDLAGLTTAGVVGSWSGSCSAQQSRRDCCWDWVARALSGDVGAIDIPS